LDPLVNAFSIIDGDIEVEVIQHFKKIPMGVAFAANPDSKGVFF
jgi:hypothetical protein